MRRQGAVTTSSHPLPIHRNGVSLQEKYLLSSGKGSALDVETKSSVARPKETDFIGTGEVQV